VASEKKGKSAAPKSKATRYQDAESLHRAIVEWAWQLRGPRLPDIVPRERYAQQLSLLARPWNGNEEIRAAHKALEKLRDALKPVAAEPKAPYYGGAIARLSVELLERATEQVEWLTTLKRPRGRGHEGWSAFKVFVHTLTERDYPGTTYDTARLDDLVADAVIAGLVLPSEYRSLMRHAGRGDDEWPTLAKGLDVTRNRVRETLRGMHRRITSK
jgi:hypothetical protein